jgi:RNA polymerase sigma factor (sigma-70 family)
MQEIGDRECLQRYARTGSEEAFSQLVSRHLNLVHSVALRKTGDAAAAEEIAQAVFIIFAQKARRLPENVVLSGWFYEAARLCAANFLRSDHRRRRREKEVFMETISNESTGETWTRVAPLLEESMGRLGKDERNAILLRFFEGKSFAEAATALGASENAVKKRVARGLDRLRGLLSKRGVNSTTQMLSGVIATCAVHSSPAGLAAKLSASAFKGHAVMASTAVLVKQVTQTMLMTKIKIASTVAAGVLFGGAACALAISLAVQQKPTAREIAQQSLDAYAALASYGETGIAVSDVDGEKSTNQFNLRLQRPSFYRIAWENGRAWSDGTGDFRSADGNGKSAPEKLGSREEAFSSPGGMSGAGVASLPAMFFAQGSGDILKPPAAGNDDPQREHDQEMDGADCYVISTHALLWTDNQGNSGTITNRLWIDKKSMLVRRTEQTWDKPTVPSVNAPRRLIFIQTHGNILPNEKFTTADFTN